MCCAWPDPQDADPVIGATVVGDPATCPSYDSVLHMTLSFTYPLYYCRVPATFVSGTDRHCFRFLRLALAFASRVARSEARIFLFGG